MKSLFSLMIAIVAIATIVAANSGYIGQNLIVNGYFLNSPCNQEVCIYNTTNTVVGWIPSPLIEVGLGFSYNQYLENQRVLLLAPRSNGCVKQVVKNLEQRVYQLIFQYAAKSDTLSQYCKFKVGFNGQIIGQITPQGDRIQTKTIEIDLRNPSDGQIQFCTFGGAFGAILLSVQLIAKTFQGVVLLQRTPTRLFDPNQQYITNGNFTQNSCQNETCQYSLGQLNRVKNWVPDPQFSIAWGSNYNRFLRHQRVLDLVPGSRSCAKQVIRNMLPGTYLLSFEYAGLSTSNSYFWNLEVQWNNVAIKRVPRIGAIISNDTVELKLNEGTTEGELKFCNVGHNYHTGYHHGSIIKSVSLKRKNDSLSSNLNIFNPIRLKSHTSKCYQIERSFLGGPVEISFNYQVISNAKVLKSVILFVQNRQRIYLIQPTNSGNHIKFQYFVPNGTHKIGFCPLGSRNEAPHQVVITNFVIEQKENCTPTWGNNLVMNGHFQRNSCPKELDKCTWSNQNFRNSVPGWRTSNSPVEIGKSLIYNYQAWRKVDVYEEKYVATLKIEKADIYSRNSCIHQLVIGFRPGRYLLSFNWAKVYGQQVSKSGVLVRANDIIVKTFESQNCDIQKEVFEFIMGDNSPVDNVLQFCAIGQTNNQRVSIDNIELYRASKC